MAQSLWICPGWMPHLPAFLRCSHAHTTLLPIHRAHFSQSPLPKFTEFGHPFLVLTRTQPRTPLLPIHRAQLGLWPSGPIEASEVPKHPGLVQWLALADSKHCAPLVQTCLSQLLRSGESTDAIHEALSSPHLRKLMEELRPETKEDIMFKMAGLPFGFQVVINR